MEKDSYTDDVIREILSLQKLTVVGMSKLARKAAHFVPKYLSENNYEITPVNPNADEILGRKSYDEISQVDGKIEVVVFRQIFWSKMGSLSCML